MIHVLRLKAEYMQEKREGTLLALFCFNWKYLAIYFAFFVSFIKRGKILGVVLGRIGYNDKYHEIRLQTSPIAYFYQKIWTFLPTVSESSYKNSLLRMQVRFSLAGFYTESPFGWERSRVSTRILKEMSLDNCLLIRSQYLILI